MLSRGTPTLPSLSLPGLLIRSLEHTLTSAYRMRLPKVVWVIIVRRDEREKAKTARNLPKTPSNFLRLHQNLRVVALTSITHHKMKVKVNETTSHPNVEQNVEVSAQGNSGQGLQVHAKITPRTGADPLTVHVTTHLPDIHLPPLLPEHPLPADKDGDESVTEPDTDDEVDHWKRYSKHLYKRLRRLESNKENRGKTVQTSVEITGGWREIWSDL
ncbi:hypothetical protein C8T65DRAFT_694638 [Cerioporus squamosus]|nr:hypothetical protein C8T65DRAFT_694638 [Cerioporus squamosus]